MRIDTPWYTQHITACHSSPTGSACHGHQKDLSQPIWRQLPPLCLAPWFWMMICEMICVYIMWTIDIHIHAHICIYIYMKDMIYIYIQLYRYKTIDIYIWLYMCIAITIVLPLMISHDNFWHQCRCSHYNPYIRLRQHAPSLAQSRHATHPGPHNGCTSVPTCIIGSVMDIRYVRWMVYL